MLLFLIALVALAIHLLIGWPWTVLGGVLAGLVKGRWGWAYGGLGVALSWMGLVFWNYIVVPAETGKTYALLGDLLGNLSPTLVVGITLLLGAVLGMLGGLIGTQLRFLIRPPAPKTVSGVLQSEEL